jgi:hypothetical protein
MNLKDCKIGVLVKTDSDELGHVVGLTYNVSVKFTGNMSSEELRARTIPLIRFPDGREVGVHHCNLSIF